MGAAVSAVVTLLGLWCAGVAMYRVVKCEGCSVWELERTGVVVLELVCGSCLGFAVSGEQTPQNLRIVIHTVRATPKA